MIGINVDIVVEHHFSVLMELKSYLGRIFQPTGNWGHLLFSVLEYAISRGGLVNVLALMRL